MITRMWRGWTRSDQADRYEQHYRSEVVVTLGQVAGFRGARLLRRTIGAETEFVSLTFLRTWTPSVRSFAGADHESAVIAEEARKMLIRFDERVCHYQTAVEARPVLDQPSMSGYAVSTRAATAVATDCRHVSGFG